jgi:hypothetical protein
LAAKARLRQVDFLDAEIAGVERLVAGEALSWPEVNRLMTVPGVSATVAAAVATSAAGSASGQLCGAGSLELCWGCRR